MACNESDLAQRQPTDKTKVLGKRIKMSTRLATEQILENVDEVKGNIGYVLLYPRIR